MFRLADVSESGVEWKEFSEGKSCGRLEHYRSRQVEMVLAHNDPAMKPETSRAGALSLQSLPCDGNHIETETTGS